MYKTNIQERRALWIAVGIMIMANVLTAGVSAGGGGSGGSEISKVEIRGDVASGQYVWNAYNFGGFFYDFRAEKWTETLKVSSISGRDIPVDDLIYETRPVTRNYQVYNIKNKPVNGENSYYLIGWQGKNYVALKGKANKFVNLLLEHNPKPEDVKVLTVGERWDLLEGYSVITQSIAPFASPPTARLVLYKNGIEVKNETVQQGEVFNYTREIAGVTDVTVFATYVDKVHTDGANDMIFLNYSWLISDNALVIQAGDRFGKLRATAANDKEIILKNDVAISLTKDSDIDIMGRMKFKVADSDILRYYPFIQFTEPGSYEIRGSAVNTSFEWNAHNFAAFFYDLKDDRKTETLNVSSLINGRDIPKGGLTYRTHTIPEEYRVFRNTGKLVNSRSTYSIIGWKGQRYVAFNDNASKISRILVDQNNTESKTFMQDESMDMPEGYTLFPDLIYPNNTARMVLKRNGTVINSSLVLNQTVWVVNENIAGETAPVFVTYIDMIASDRIRIKYMWLISGNFEIVRQQGDRHGDLVVDIAGNSELVLKNDAGITFSGESIIDIMDGLRFSVNNNLRYYPFVRINVTGSPSQGNRACATMCHYYKKPVNADFYPNANISFDRVETYLGILSDRNTPWTNVTKPRIEFWWNPSQLYGNAWDYFIKTQPRFYDPVGYADFMLRDFSPVFVEDGTYAVDVGARNMTTGYSVTRTVTNDGFVSESGNYTVNITVMLYEYADGLGIGINLDERDEVKAKLQKWSASGSPTNNTDKNGRWININYGGPSYPAQYEFSVTYYVDKIIPGNFTYKPRVSVERQITNQWNDTIGNATSVSIKGKHFNMNSSFYSENPVQWTYSEQFVRQVELQGIKEVLGPYAEFEFNKDLVVESRNDSLHSGSYDKNLQYSMNINNKEDTSKTVLGEINFSVQADNITDVGWGQYANWNGTFAKWSFPLEYVIRENERLGTNMITSYYEPGYLNVDISRQMNKTVFISEGYQLAKFNVTFKDKDFEWAWARIEANNQYGVDAFVVPGTFTNDNNAQGNFGEWEHGVQFDFDKEQIQTGVTYNFSVILRVKPNDQRAPPIIYKPGFVIGERLYSSLADGGKGQEIEIPSSMLPEHVSHVSASTNTSSTWLVRRQNQTGAKLQDVSDITGPHSEFTISRDLVMMTENDYLSSGNYKSNLSYYLNIYNEGDDSDTTLGDIRLSARAQNITGPEWGQYAVWNSTAVNWTFPQDFVIRENEGFGAGFGTDDPESGYLGVNVSRWINQTDFSTTGFQFARFNLTFVNKDFEWVWGEIKAEDFSGVNASIVRGSFTFDVPVNRVDESDHRINLDIDKERIQTGVTYNFSVIVRIDTDGNVTYKPEFSIGEGLYSKSQAQDVSNNTVDVPDTLLPEHVSRVSATTNISNAWMINRYDQIIATLGKDRTPPIISEFGIEPNSSVSANNPAKVRAIISDDDLKNIGSLIVDSENSVSSNMTVLTVYENNSGLNGKYESSLWYANRWNILNGSVDDIITTVYYTGVPDQIGVFGSFKKNASTDDREALLWFNSTTLELSKITSSSASGLVPFIIENGISNIKIARLGFMKGFVSAPTAVITGTYTLYDPGSPENPYLVSVLVPSGNYKAIVHAADRSGNDRGEMVDFNVDNSPPSVYIISPLNGTIVSSSNVTITGTASDNYGIKTGCFEHRFDSGASSGCGGLANATKILPFAINVTLHEGSNFIKVTYLDAANNSGSASVNVTLRTGTGKPPVADCGADKLRCENVGTPVQFNASASYDLDGTIVSYAWEFGDGMNGTGAVLKHTYSTYRWNGTAYLPLSVNLTVTDNGGLTNTTHQKVVIWIAGDANGDGIVNIIDASIVGLRWNNQDSCADLNNDEKVNIIDASIIGLNWNKKAEKNA